MNTPLHFLQMSHCWTVEQSLGMQRGWGGGEGEWLGASGLRGGWGSKFHDIIEHAKGGGSEFHDIIKHAKGEWGGGGGVRIP